MAKAVAPKLFTIPPHRAFSDALAAGLLRMHGKDPLGLARGIILVPTNRTARAVQDAFVRRADTGLLMPRLVPIGDPDIVETLGNALDPIGTGVDIPPAIAPLERTMRLATIVQRTRDKLGEPVDAGEAVRLARDLAATLDQLLIEKVDPGMLAESVDGDLAEHWKVSLDQLDMILTEWPAELAKLGKVDMAERRNQLLEHVAKRPVSKSRRPSGIRPSAGSHATPQLLPD